MLKIRIIGSGSWGTALAQVLADNNQDVLIWGRDENEVHDIQTNHRNERYFPGVQLTEKLQATTDFSAIADADILLLAVPTIAIEDMCQKISELFDHPVTIINVAKGFHPITHERLSVVIQRNMKEDKLRHVVSLIGPSHAEEVVLRLLTSVNAVCEDDGAASEIQELFSNEYFRVYRNTDVIGAEVGVAVKNVIALASGVLSGLGEGDNARAALITRGLAEMARYGIALGGLPETYLGLTGVGDLIVTCTSQHSRNFQAGYLIGKQDDAAVFWEKNKATVEGVRTAKVVHEEAKLKNISMPITEQIYKVLYEGQKPSSAIRELMSRELKAE